MVSASYRDGDYIIRQGDENADTFFILFEGEAVATKSYGGQLAVEVMHYAKGDYFGEIALLNHIPRSASVIARGDCKVVSIDRRSFARLLGTLPSRTYA